jgi:catechol 2,3-dioxygenase-like lactoylglutathione lyase family enzyme
VATVSVRYIVDDVDAALAFYCRHLGFEKQMQPAPTFAMLTRGDLRLLLSAPGGGPGGGQAMADGNLPTPGGWNRFSLEVADLAGTVDRLREAGVHLRSDLITGVGGKQVVIDDPSGNPSSCSNPRVPMRTWSHGIRQRFALLVVPRDSSRSLAACHQDDLQRRGHQLPARPSPPRARSATLPQWSFDAAECTGSLHRRSSSAISVDADEVVWWEARSGCSSSRAGMTPET